MILRLTILVLRRVLGWLVVSAVMVIFGGGPLARRVLRGLRVLRRLMRL